MKIIKVGLIFHSAGNDNLGVGALSVANVSIIRKAAKRANIEVEIVIMDGTTSRPPYITAKNVLMRPTRPLRKPIDFFNTVKKCDVVIDIGGGDSFTDIYGYRRFAQIIFMKYLTHLSGVPLVLAPQTFGPFNSRIAKFFAKQSIRLSSVVSTRDQLSTSYLKDLHVLNEIIEASDVALQLPYTTRRAKDATGPVKIGINISGLLMSGGYSQNNMFNLKVDYGALMEEVIRGFDSLPIKCEIHLVPHVISWSGLSKNVPGLEDDYSASKKVQERYNFVEMAPAFATPSEAKSYIAEMDFFLGARMHACIAAFSTGVPVVPLAYSRKFEGLFGSLGFKETVDCAKENKEEILSRIFSAFERRSELKQEQAKALEIGLDKLQLYEKALEDFFREI